MSKHQAKTHHGDFALHALLYVARLAAEQRYDTVLSLGLRRDQADAVRSMTTQDLHELALTIRSHFLDLRIDQNAFDVACSVLRQRRGDDELDRALILAGARYEMMRQLSGMSTVEYARHRRFLRVDGCGRPQAPAAAEQDAVWRAWLDTADEPNEKRRFLAMYEITNVPAGSIWRLVRGWESSGIMRATNATVRASARRHKTHQPTGGAYA